MKQEVDFGSILNGRRSVREFSNDPISIEDLNRLLWAVQGQSDSGGKRTIPSAKATYPLKVMVAMGNVLDADKGIGEYNSANNELKLIQHGDIRNELSRAAIGDQPWLADAAVVITLCADLASVATEFQMQEPYGRRGITYAYIEVGAALQNAALQATALGLGSVIVGGFQDSETCRVLELPSPFSPIAHICIGWPRV